MVIAVSPERLARDLDALALLGQDPAGGMTRLALSPADAAARALVREQMVGLGMAVSHDEVGNLVGRWGAPRLPSVMSGSHLDSVPRGGRYDGPLGVVGALEAVRALREAGFEPSRPLEVVVFTGEEGSRFGRGTIGSAAFSGDVPVADIHALRDASGTSFAEALATYGDAGPPLPAARAPGSVAAFVELHIEQGGVLESRELEIGAVTTIAGLVQQVVRLEGVANHAGATPMDLRHDALTGAAAVVLGCERLAGELGRGAVATVGKLEVEPGAFNIIPGAAVLGIDSRAPDPEVLDALERGVRELAERVAAARGLKATVTRRQRVAPGPMDDWIVGAVERATAATELRSLRMPSGAIHDALHMASFCPSGMIFIPSHGGKSHCPDEHSSLRDMVRGVEVLARTLAELSEATSG
jgi:hydantoinase/carbamoylase family amidase